MHNAPIMLINLKVKHNFYGFLLEIGIYDINIIGRRQAIYAT